MSTALSEYLNFPFLFFTMELGGLTGDKICYSCVPGRRCQLQSLTGSRNRKKLNCHFHQGGEFHMSHDASVRTMLSTVIHHVTSLDQNGRIRSNFVASNWIHKPKAFIPLLRGFCLYSWPHNSQSSFSKAKLRVWTRKFFSFPFRKTNGRFPSKPA